MKNLYKQKPESVYNNTSFYHTAKLVGIAFTFDVFQAIKTLKLP